MKIKGGLPVILPNKLIFTEDTEEPEKLIGGLKGVYSRRINIQHRIVYQVLENEKTVKILRMWTHYE